MVKSLKQPPITPTTLKDLVLTDQKVVEALGSTSHNHCIQRENFQGPFQSWKVQVWSFCHNFHPKSRVCDIWLSEISGESQEWTHDNFWVISCSQIVLLSNFLALSLQIVLLSIISIAIYLLISMSTDMGYLLSPLGPKDMLTIFFVCQWPNLSLRQNTY